jgi:hypothetical protein
MQVGGNRMRKKQVCPCLNKCTAPTRSCVFVCVVLSKKKKKKKISLDLNVDHPVSLPAKYAGSRAAACGILNIALKRYQKMYVPIVQSGAVLVVTSPCLATALCDYQICARERSEPFGHAWRGRQTCKWRRHGISAAACRNLSHLCVSSNATERCLFTGTSQRQ